MMMAVAVAKKDNKKINDQTNSNKALADWRTERDDREQQEKADAARLLLLTPEDRERLLVAKDEAHERLRALAYSQIPDRIADKTTKDGSPFYRPWKPIRRDPITGARLDSGNNYAGEDNALVFVRDPVYDPQAPRFLTFEELKKLWGAAPASRLTEMPLCVWFGADLVFHEWDKSKIAREARGEPVGNPKTDPKPYDSEGKPNPDYVFTNRKGCFTAHWPRHNGANYPAYCAFLADLSRTPPLLRNFF